MHSSQAWVYYQEPLLSIYDVFDSIEVREEILMKGRWGDRKKKYKYI